MTDNQSVRSQTVRRAFEIAYALFRIAGASRSKAYGIALEEVGVRLVQAVTRGDKLKTLVACEEGRQFTDLGLGSDLIAVRNGTTVLSLIKNLEDSVINFTEAAFEVDIHVPGETNPGNSGLRNSVFRHSACPPEAMRRRERSEGSPEHSKNVRNEILRSAQNDDLREFSNSEQSEEEIWVTENNVPEETEVVITNGGILGQGRDESPTSEVPTDNFEESVQVVSGEAKQLAILNFIRTTGEAKMKDLQNLFPDVDERLFRYHLQKLGQKGFIERVKTKVPSNTYYKPIYPDTLSGYKLPDNRLVES